jgi:hypothetical protein
VKERERRGERCDWRFVGTNIQERVNYGEDFSTPQHADIHLQNG